MAKYKIIKIETSHGHTLVTEDDFDLKEHAIAWYNKEGIRAVTEGLRMQEEWSDGILLAKGDNSVKLRMEEYA